MSLDVLVLILGAATAHAGWNLAAKRAGDGGPAFVWLYACVASALLSPVVVVSVAPVWSGRTVAVMAGSALLHLGYFLCLQRGYAVGDLSVVYPLARGLGPALSVSLAILWLGERPGVLTLVGGAAVVMGVVLVGVAGRSRAAGMGRSAVMAGVGLGAVAGVFIGGYTVWDAHAVTALAVPPLLLEWGNSVGRVLALAPYALRSAGRVRGVWRAYRVELLAVAVLSPLAYVLTLIALTRAPVSVVAPGRELSVVMATLLGWLVLHEPHPARRLAGAFIVAAGVAVLTVS